MLFLNLNILATVKYSKLKDKYKFYFKQYLHMIGGSILQSIAKIRAEYDVTSEAAEFLMLAFYIVNDDQEAISAHQIWRQHAIVIKESMIDRTQINAELNIDNLKRDQLPYLTDKDIEDLKVSEFFISLDRNSFRINKTKFL